MKKGISLLLILALCLGSLSAVAEEVIYAVGGDALEEAVRRLPGYLVEFGEDGSQTIVMTDLTGEFYYDQSENGIAIMPVMMSMMGFQLHVISFCWPLDEYAKVTKLVITTDQNIHTLVPNTPWTIDEPDGKGKGIMANEALKAVLFEMGKSENVSVEFFQDNKNSKVYELTMEQKYLLRQYVYACETFLPQPEAYATASLVMALISNQFAYTISTVPNPNGQDEKPTAYGNPTPAEAGTSVEPLDMDTVKEALNKLLQLQEEGLITQEDYDAKKKQLLGL